jgi:WD40 repeat protein
MTDIFVSYSRVNADFAKDLYQKLTDLKFTLWRDIHDIPAGADWWNAIKEGIEGCDTLVLCMSLPALRSPIVSDEWNYARELGKRVVPVIADEVFKHPDVVDKKFVIPKWMERANWIDLRDGAPEREAKWERFVLTLRTPHTPHYVHITRKARELPPNFVPRPEETEALIQPLVDENRSDAVAITAALKGAGGYGKTTLAKAICRDLRVNGAFHDGIFWVTLGEELLKKSKEARDNEIVTRLLDLAAEMTGTRPAVSTLDAAQEELAKAIADRYIMLVVDDAWHVSHVKPFVFKGKHNATLITTRDSAALPDDTLTQPVDEMKLSEASELLCQNLRPDMVRGKTKDFNDLAERLGNYPLLLGAVNGVLRKQMAKPNQTMTDALSYVNERLDARGLSAFDSKNPQERHEAVTTTFDVSLDFLDNDDGERYLQLGIFPEDARVPVNVLAALWNCSEIDAEDLCERLHNASLIQDYDGASIQLHDVVRDYLRDKRKMSSVVALHERVLKPWKDVYALPDTYAWQFIGFHLIQAGQKDKLRALLLDYHWLRAKLNATDVNALIADCDLLANSDTIMNLFRSALTMSAHMIALDKNLLTDQLYGRLWTHDDKPEIAALRGQIKPNLKLVPEHHPAHEQAGGALLRTLSGHSSYVNGCAFSPDGRWILSGAGSLFTSQDNTLKVWDAVSGVERLTLRGHSSKVNDCTYSPDGRFILSASDDNTLKVWDANTGAERLTLTGHTNSVNACAYSPDGKYILSASDDDTLKVWDAITGVERLTLTGHTNSVKACAYSPDGRFILSASIDNTLKMWDANIGIERLTLTGHRDAVKACAYSPDGRFILSASDDTTLKIWDAITGVERLTLIGHWDFITGCAYSPDGKHIVSTAYRKLKVWDAITGVERLTLIGHTVWVNDCTYSPDGKHILSASDDNTLKVWDAEMRPEQLTLTEHTHWVTGCTYSPDGKHILSASADNTLKVWDAATGIEQLTLTGHTHWVTGCAYSPDGKYILSASEDNTLKVWDAITGVERLTLTGHTKWVNDCTYSPDGKYILSASEDDTLKVWDAITGVERLTLTGHRGNVNGCAYSPDGKYILSASDDNTLKVWDAATGIEQLTLTGHTNWVNDCTYSPDGKHILSASIDNTLKVWDAVTGTEQLTLTGHKDAVKACVYSPDGKYIVSASEDNTLKVWDVETKICLATFHGEAVLLCCAWAMKEHIVAGDRVGRVMLFRLQL